MEKTLPSAAEPLEHLLRTSRGTLTVSPPLKPRSKIVVSFRLSYSTWDISCGPTESLLISVSVSTQTRCVLVDCINFSDFWSITSTINECIKSNNIQSLNLNLWTQEQLLLNWHNIQILPWNSVLTCLFFDTSKFCIVYISTRSPVFITIFVHYYFEVT